LVSKRDAKPSSCIVGGADPALSATPTCAHFVLEFSASLFSEL
jgi:hypothetical protein